MLTLLLMVVLLLLARHRERMLRAAGCCWAVALTGLCCHRLCCCQQLLVQLLRCLGGCQCGHLLRCCCRCVLPSTLAGLPDPHDARCRHVSSACWCPRLAQQLAQPPLHLPLLRRLAGAGSCRSQRRAGKELNQVGGCGF